MSELMHYGILGMKWGVRRFQNPDGTLTEEGKKRYSSDETNSGVSDHDRAITKKNIKSMTDKEVNDEINRRQREAMLADLRKKKTLTKGANKVRNALGVIGALTAIGEFALKLKGQGEGLFKWMLQGEGINTDNLKGSELWPLILNKDFADDSKILLDIPIEDIMLTKE